MNKIVTILVAAMFFLVPATYSQTSLMISPTTITGNTGETVTVSLIVNDFTDIVSMQYGVKWDPAVIQYNSVDNFDLTDLSAGNFNAGADPGFLSFSWFDNTTQGISVPDGTTLYTMSFTVLGDASSGSTITFASRQGLAIEVASSTAGEITNAVTFTDAQFGDPNGNGSSGNTGSATPLVSSISSASGDNGTTVCVDISVASFTDITTMNYSLNWDAAVLQFSEVKNINLAGLSQGSFDVTGTASGQLGVSWVNAGGATANDGAIYQACFNLTGAAGTSSAVSFSDTPTPISVTTTTSATSVGITQGNGTISVNTVTPPPSTGTSLINISALDAEAGSTVCVPVTINDFEGIASLQFSLAWDPAVLQFTAVQNFNIPDLNAGSFNTTLAANGQMAMAWFDNTAQGVTLADGTTIFEMCFTVLGASGTASNITFSDTPTQREAATANATIPFTGATGAVTVDGGTVTPPPPPPTSTGDAFINIAALNTPVGSTVCVPVTVNDFDAIASLQFSLQWDPAVLQFNEVTNFNLPDLNAASFNTTQTASGQTAMAWFDNTAQGVTLEDGTILFEMCFTVLGVDGTSSGIIFTDSPTQREAATSNNTITFTETNGSVIVGDGDVVEPPPPPPATGGDEFINLSTLSAEAGSTVCLPVTVNDFNAIASLQFSLAWDPTILEFAEVKNFNLPDLNAGGFNTTATANGQAAMAWFDNTAQGVTLQDGATLFEICFTVVGTTGANSTIVFADSPTQREAATSNNTITFTQTDGTVTVGSGTPPPPPPPPTGDGILNIGEISAPSGGNICVPITAMDFDGIAAMQFSLAWDPAVLEFTGTQNFGLTDLAAGSFNIDGTANGQIAVAWFDNAAQGITLADGTIIFELCFNVIGANGTNTTITFTDTPTARELAIASGTIDFLSTDGTITVEEGIIVPPPPPGDGIINIGAIESPPGSSVCIPVSVKDFTGIASMQFSLAWDPTVLQFTGVGEAFGLPDLSAASFNVDGTANGQLALAWFDQAAQGVTLTDGTELFEMCFDVIGADGATSTISFTDVPTTRELATANTTIDFLSTDGSFTVKEAIIVMPPDTMQQPLDQLVNIANQVITAGEAFCVPVVVADFDAIAALQFSMGWNPAVIEFTGVQTFGLPDLTANTFNTDGAANGAIALAWFDNSAQGVTLMDGDVLFEVCFNAVGTDGTSTVIAFTDTPTQREAATANVTVPFTQTNGTISIGVEVTCPGPITATAIPTNVTCNGMNDGAISLTVAGGDETYTYTWSDATIGNIPNPTGLAAGVYNVTITSCNGDEVKSDIAAASLTITEPPAMTTVVTPENATCFGVADGRINLSLSGGTLPYTYQWSDATLAPDNRPVNVPAGTYSVTITDAAGCQDIMDNITITSPSEIVATVATTPASCTGIADGTIMLTTSGGSGGDYTYNWGASGLEGATPTNVAAGDYTVIITDGNQCTSEILVTVAATVTISGMVQVIEDACGDNSGAIQITPAGGTAPYSYTWTGPVDIGNTGTVENIPTGTYSVTVTDANGCFYVENIEVGGPTAILSASNMVTDVACAGESNGTISVTAAGGFSPYTYAWSNGATIPDNADLPAGEYTVTITDSKVCTYTETFTVGTQSNLSVTVEITKGAPDATAIATATGGVEPYTYEWCNGQTTSEATGLAEGNCSLTVIDALGCTVVENIDIVVNNPEVTIAMTAGISCNGLTDGALQATATGGKPTYTYAWNTGATTSDLASIGGGTYEVTVTDETGNIGTATFDLAEPAALVIDLAEPISMDCTTNGKICINISGGTMPYKEIKWSNDVMDALCIEGLRAGDYGVIITDQNDCTKEENFRVDSDPNCIDCLTSIKVMTPNDDGRNDAFILNCVDTAPNNHLEIYNRWGQLVFEADDYQCISGGEGDCWRGRTRGDRPVDEGGYFWILEFDDTDGRKRIKDHITILNDN